jgi:uncharacterized protein YegP (UPF0339 family)
MLISETENEKFYNLDKLQIYKNENGVFMLALRDVEVTRADSWPVDFEITESSVGNFVKELHLANGTELQSMILKNGLLNKFK